MESKKIKVALLAAAILMPSMAWATCNRQDWPSGVVRPPIQMPWLGEAIVRQNGTVGENLRPVTPVSDDQFALLCLPNQLATFRGRWDTPAGWTLQSSSGGDLMQTNLAGVGVVVTSNGSRFTGGIDRVGAFEYQRVISPSEGQPANAYRGLYDNTSYSVALVRTAPSLAYGRLSAGRFFYMSAAGPLNPVFREMNSVNIVVRAASCSVRAGDLNQTVALGTHAQSTLMRDGGSPWVNFTITSEDCDTAQLQNARYTFSAPPEPSNPALFQARAAGSAAPMNLGLEIQAIPTGGPVAVVPNTMLTVPSLNTPDNYEFRARLRTLASGAPQPGMIETPVRVNVDFM